MTSRIPPILLFLLFCFSCQSKTTAPDSSASTSPQTASYTLTGDVPNPGPRELYENESVVSALTDAGFNHDTRPWPDQVALKRPAKNGNPKATAVIDLRQMLQSGNMEHNYLLEPGDVLYVPHPQRRAPPVPSPFGKR